MQCRSVRRRLLIVVGILALVWWILTRRNTAPPEPPARRTRPPEPRRPATNGPVASPEPQPEPPTRRKPPATRSPNPPTRRKPPSDPQPEPADDLAAIDGIGPKIAKVLREAGYATFDSVAASNEADLRRTLADAGLRLAPTLATWPAQAAELAALRGGNRRPADS
ncbi:MAG: helix-hairpin-helix domain-containing protein [Microthrixaceae bacterium]